MEVLMKRHVQQYTLIGELRCFSLSVNCFHPSNQSLAADQNEYLTELTLKELMDSEVITPARILENAKKLLPGG
jgi:hypothetical protein